MKMRMGLIITFALLICTAGHAQNTVNPFFQCVRAEFNAQLHSQARYLEIDRKYPEAMELYKQSGSNLDYIRLRNFLWMTERECGKNPHAQMPHPMFSDGTRYGDRVYSTNTDHIRDGSNITATYPDGLTASIDRKSWSTYPKNLQSVFKKVKDESRPNDPNLLKRREYGAWAFELDDGTFRVFEFTSDHILSINNNDYLKFSIKYPSLEEVDERQLPRSRVTRVFHMHTHPTTATTWLAGGFLGDTAHSDLDILFAQEITPAIQKWIEKEVPVEFIVLHNNPSYESSVFSYMPPKPVEDSPK